MARLLARALDAAGFQPAVEPGGVSGLQRLQGGGFSLLVLDLTLPDSDGGHGDTFSSGGAAEYALTATGVAITSVEGIVIGNNGTNQPRFKPGIFRPATMAGGTA